MKPKIRIKGDDLKKLQKFLISILVPIIKKFVNKKYQHSARLISNQN